MNYYFKYKAENEVEQISKERAKEMLTGWWKDEYLNDLFENNKPFRSWTAFVEVWTDDEGEQNDN